jgi:hypothetical protein
MMKRLNAAVAKRLAAAGVAAGLILGGGLAGAAPAAADQSQGIAWFYSGTNYSGQANWMNYNDFSWRSWGYGIHSVINHTPENFCGQSRYGTNRYTFWAGGAWNYIGSPFTSSNPMWYASAGGC